MPPPQSQRVARDRCEQVWALLAPALSTDGRGRFLLLDRPGGQPATLWPYSQVLHAAVLVAHLRGSAEPVRSLGAGLSAYRLGRAYQPRRGGPPGRRYVDDNAWVGLAASHAALLSPGGQVGGAVADRLAAWVARFQTGSGGVRWRERDRGLHACSTGAGGVLALRAPGRPPELRVARACASFLLGPLRRPDGLVADNLRVGRLDPTAWSYNQGLAIGLLTLLHAHGEPDALDQARQLAQLTVAHFDPGERLVQEPPCFAAVLGRMLLLLHSYDRDPRWVDVVDAYLDHVWASGADRGLVGGGIGAYDDERSLDWAGLAILTALRASPIDELRLVC